MDPACPSSARQLAACQAFPDYGRRRPEETVLYKTVAEHLETFFASTDGDPSRKGLPEYVREEFYEYLKCGVLAHGFLRVRCEGCHREKLVAFSCKRRGFCPSCGGRKMAETAAFLVDEVFPKVPIRQWVLSFPFPLRYLMASNAKVQSAILAITFRAIAGLIRKKVRSQGFTGPVTSGAVTLIQRFGGSINLNVHFHMLVLEGAYAVMNGEFRWIAVSPPTDEEVREMIRALSVRILGHLIRKGYFEKEDELLREGEDPLSKEDPMLAACLSASVQSKIALGERAGQKVRHLGTMTMCFHEEAELSGSRCAALGGFSLHADTACGPYDRNKLEHLCRYVARPPVAIDRLSKRPDGLLVYKLKTPYRDGTQYLIFSPEELLEKLAALVPIPRVHLIRFHGCLAPHSRIRSQVVPGPKTEDKDDADLRKNRRRSCMSWAMLLKRVFRIDIETCSRCGGRLRIIAVVLTTDAIEGILLHLGLPTQPPNILPARGPPQGIFEW